MKVENIRSNKSMFVLSDNDLDYMYSIYNSSLSKEDKCKKLITFCSYDNLCYSYDVYVMYRKNGINDSKLERIHEFIKIYKNYKLTDKSYKYVEKYNYKCSEEELKERLEKLKEAYLVINSNESDYNKAEKLYKLYPSLTQFKKAYVWINRYAIKEERFSMFHEALNNYEEICDFYQKYEENGIFADVKYILNMSKYQYWYNYAKFALNHYISNEDSYKTKTFLEELGIDLEIFNCCVDVVKYCDNDLYLKFVNKNEANKKIRLHKLTKLTEELAYAIQNGCFYNGEAFNILEFLKRIPYKGDKFIEKISEFLKFQSNDTRMIIFNYIKKEKLFLPGCMEQINNYDIKEITTSINGYRLNSNDIDNIIKYLKVNGYPLINRCFSFAKQMYVNGEINMGEVLKKEIEIDSKENKKYILIPSAK